MTDWTCSVDWATIDTVLLDMDGTLLDLHFDNFFWRHHLPQRYSEQYGIQPEIVFPQIERRLVEKQGTLDWYCTEFWSRELKVDVISLKNEIKHLISERPQVTEFLTNLGTIGKQRILVTNAHRDSVDIKLSVTSIGPLLDQLVSSHDYGYPKEDQAFWHYMQQNIAFDPARTLFIDDCEAVLRSARHYGIAYLLGISKPDSQQKENVYNDFPALQQFQQILNLNQG